MSYLKFLGLLPLLPLTVRVISLPVTYYTSRFSPIVKTEPSGKDPLKNFQGICNASPRELSYAVCPKIIKNYIPILHGSYFRIDSKETFKKLINASSYVGAGFAGLLAASFPISSFFYECMKTTTVARCVASGIEDLAFDSGPALLSGALITALVAKKLLIDPVVNTLTLDSLEKHRIQLVESWYKQIQEALTKLLDKPAGDPELHAIVPFARLFLRLYPSIETELSLSAGIERDKVREILHPIRAICRQILSECSTA